jgi:hypothetical protein
MSNFSFAENILSLFRFSLKLYWQNNGNLPFEKLTMFKVEQFLNVVKEGGFSLGICRGHETTIYVSVLYRLFGVWLSERRKIDREIEQISEETFFECIKNMLIVTEDGSQKECTVKAGPNLSM